MATPKEVLFAFNSVFSKMSNEYSRPEVLEILQYKDFNSLEFKEFNSELEGFGPLSFVENPHDGAPERLFVIKFEEQNVFLGLPGNYSSWDGTTWDKKFQVVEPYSRIHYRPVSERHDIHN